MKYKSKECFITIIIQHKPSINKKLSLPSMSHKELTPVKAPDLRTLTECVANSYFFSNRAPFNLSKTSSK